MAQTRWSPLLFQYSRAHGKELYGHMFQYLLQKYRYEYKKSDDPSSKYLLICIIFIATKPKRLQ